MEKIIPTEVELENLSSFLKEIPAISWISHGHQDKFWWIKFSIDIQHSLAWNVVQELGHIVNYISINEKLPTKFYPVSPPPHMNGGPIEFLSWIIENQAEDFTPNDLQEWLMARLPDPINDLEAWGNENS